MSRCEDRLQTGLAFVFPCVILALMGPGCRHEPRSGVNRSSITIAVRQNREPLQQGTIDLTHKTSGEGASGTLDSSGKVTLTGIADGEYTVLVQPPPSLAPDGSELPKTGKFTVSSKYRSVATSPLTVVVDGEHTSFELDVE